MQDASGAGTGPADAAVGASQAVSATAAAANATATSAQHEQEALATPADVHAAFLLGWSVAELIGRIQVPAVTTAKTDRVGKPPSGPDFLPFVTAASDVFWLVSMWRVNFDRMSQLTSQLFPKSSTLNTRWDPGAGQPPYLYPKTPADDPLFVDYADVGTVREPDGSVILQNFRLHEATRRALNSLSLLKLSVQDSLLPEVLTQQQQQLVDAVLGVTAAAPEPDTGEPTPPTSENLKAAGDVITARLLLFLHAWEGYLRESFYAAGASARNETELVAFEAGRSTAALSWGITVQVLAGKPRAEVWKAAFSDPTVSRLQHQIAVLTDALAGETDTGLAGSGWIPSEAEENVPAADALDVVARSLNYWQRATLWMINANGTDAQWEQMRLALIEQTGIWQALCLGQVDVSAYTSPGVIQRILQDVVDSFEQLAVQEGLVSASQQVSNEAVALMKTASEQVEQLNNQVEKITAKLTTSMRRQIVATLLGVWPMLVLGLVAVLALAVFVLRFTQTGGGNGSDVAAAFLAVLGGLGLWGTHTQSQAATNALVASPPQVPPSTTPGADAAPAGAGMATTIAAAPASLAMHLGSILGRAGETVLQDFEKGFKQIQTDLRYLSRTVAVTYPLVEYFVLDGHIANVDEAYDFIELVIWRKDEQKQEVMRVAYAAFGAIGSFAMAKVFTSDAVPRITGAANNTASEATTGQPSDRSVVPSDDRSPTQPASPEPTAAPQHATPPSAEPNLPGSQPPAEPGQRLHA